LGFSSPFRKGGLKGILIILFHDSSYLEENGWV
jgi:hypothetical protein